MKVIRQTATVKAKGAKGNTVNKVSTKEPIKKYAVKKKTSASTPKNSSKKASTPSKAQKQKQAGSQKMKGKC